MKKGTMKCEWLYTDAGFAGASLGYEYAAEHECGIYGIRNKFEINKTEKEKKLFGIKLKSEPVFGLDVRTIKKNAARLVSGDGFYIITTKGENYDQFIKSLGSKLDKEIVAYWDDEDFALVSTNKTYIDRMMRAFVEKDIAIFSGAPGLMGNACLNLYIASMVPQEMKDAMRKSDEHAFNTNKKAQESGIYKKLEKAELKYFALSPSMSESGVLRFWLNPYEQQQYEAGWYTLEELEEWIEGKGPIVKEKKREGTDAKN